MLLVSISYFCEIFIMLEKNLDFFKGTFFNIACQIDNQQNIPTACLFFNDKIFIIMFFYCDIF